MDTPARRTGGYLFYRQPTGGNTYIYRQYAHRRQKAGMLESGKAVREKKALPILGKLLKYARSLFRENTELKAKVQKLEKENTAFKSANWNHTNEIVKLKMENRELKKDKGKLDALVGRIGNDVLQKALEEISKEYSKSQKDNKDEMR